jgi:hypothetical protein
MKSYYIIFNAHACVQQEKFVWQNVVWSCSILTRCAYVLIFDML